MPAARSAGGERPPGRPRLPTGFEQRLDDFKQRGVRIVAISVDTPAQNAELREKQKYTYAFLS
ncbi:MAG: peroxiredoxin family protein, partial [Candidatus Acidiferrales bacterium]